MGGGGGGRGGGGGGGRGGGGGGGRRSDMALKHDVTLLGHLDNGLGYYRFSYNGSDKAYVGVMAQEVQELLRPMPSSAVTTATCASSTTSLGCNSKPTTSGSPRGRGFPSAAPQPH